MKSPDTITKAVFPAAGLGTRFLPATKAIPKEMLPLMDRPCIQWVMEEAVQSGLTQAVLVTARGKGAIEDHFDRNAALEIFLQSRNKSKELELISSVDRMCTVSYVRQAEPRGLGHAVLTARPFVGDDDWFAVLLGDDIVDEHPPFIGQMVKYACRHNKAVVALQRVPRERVSAYGVVAAVQEDDGGWAIRDLVEKPSVEEAPSDLAVVGRYILPPGIFSILENTRPGKGGEIQLTDALRELAFQGQLMGLEIHGRRLDTGTPLGLLEATLYFGLRSAEQGDDVRAMLTRVLEETP